MSRILLIPLALLALLAAALAWSGGAKNDRAAAGGPNDGTAGSRHTTAPAHDR